MYVLTEWTYVLGSSAMTPSVKKIIALTFILWKLSEEEPSEYLNKGKQIIF